MRKIANLLLEYGLLIIITIPAFISLINPYFFSMHDSQQVARLYVLSEGLRQGVLYPRWVDLFGFNYGYPLFNFYPPLIYYVGMLFHSLGFTYLWSVKMVFISGYVLAALGMYLLVKKLIGKSRDLARHDIVAKASAYIAATLYTYFTYHAVNTYVRGAMAEFFSMAVLPFVFLSLEALRKGVSLKNAVWFGITFALLILTHPLIAFPSLIFIGAYMVHSFILSKEKMKYAAYAATGSILGLLLSSFYWLPSMLERKYTLVDSILLKELASYQIHFVCPSQLWFSPWGYGGSGAGCVDGMSFQLGKMHIAVVLVSLLAFVVFLVTRNKRKDMLSTPMLLKDYGFYVLFMLFSIFMTLDYSQIIWKNVTFLQYLQFPWRFFTFTDLFLSVVGGVGIYFFAQILDLRLLINDKIANLITVVVAIVIAGTTVVAYQKYFKPQIYLHQSDKELTSFDEIAWRVSRTSFEFVPKGVTTKKSDLNTTILAIEKSDLNRSLFNLTNGTGTVTVVNNTYADKAFDVDSTAGFDFRLHTYNFPGWTAYVDGVKTPISDMNDFKLITVSVPAGRHHLRFSFENTPVRTMGDWGSIVSLVLIVLYLGIKYLQLPHKKS